MKETDTNFIFSVSEAVEFGCKEAILIKTLKLNNSILSKNELFTLLPFWTKKQLRRILESCVHQNIVVRLKQESSFDKTIYYKVK